MADRTDESRVVKAVVAELSNKVASAAETLDVKEFANLLDDDYMSVDFDGKTHTKEERVAEWKAQDFKASSVTVHDHKVRVFGDTAVATGVASVRARYHGQDISGEYAFTQVFRHRNGLRLSSATTAGDLVMTHSTGTRLTSAGLSSAKSLVADLSRRVASAAETLDVKEFANLLHDDYMSVDFDGKTHTKEERVAEWKAQDFKASSVTVHDQKVRVFGETAIATGIASVKAKYHGQDISGLYSFTQVFRHRNDMQLAAAATAADLVMTHSTGIRLS